ncbi:hypothetical protein F5876DRAFT_79846 [Lentinula aff. lateritia]|uniref:Uncharacterized protein n=1 Tax=Lentinula aff. lateritia TaxID=2804960 RepID=A0ACC1TRN0_9AGAR|nr:hypothetical protein F5876DRAFT_79846 [Lentinula aff. lateritia]
MPSPRPLLTSCHISYTNSSATSEGTTVSQPAGLGSTTAHFFHSLGSFAVRRIDAHIVNRRLLDIQTRFPHRNHEFVPDDDYNVLIEVSRPGMSYDGFSRHRALQVLSLQIGREQVAQLTRRLLMTWQQEWHQVSDELTMLLRELWKECSSPGSKMYIGFGKYTSHPEQTLPHLERSFLDFCLQLCQVEPGVFASVMDIGFNACLCQSYHIGTLLICVGKRGIIWAPASFKRGSHQSPLKLIYLENHAMKYSMPALTSLGSLVDCLLTGVIYSSNDDLSILAIDCLVQIIKSGEGSWWDTLSDVLAENTYRDLSDVVDLMLNDSYVHTNLEKPCVHIRDAPSPQHREYSSSLSLGQTPTIFSQSPTSGFSIQDCFINLILHIIASNPSFKDTLVNTAFFSLFLRHISQHLHPPISTTMDIDFSQSRQTVQELLSAIAGGNSLYHFSGNTMPRVRKRWEKVLRIFGQCPEVYMPVKPAWSMVSHEQCHISCPPKAKSQPSRLIQFPSSVASQSASDQSRLEAERKSNQTKQSARREDFLRIASSLGLLPEMSHTDSILKEGLKAEVPRSSRAFQQRKRESDFFHVAGELGLMLPPKRS